MKLNHRQMKNRGFTLLLTLLALILLTTLIVQFQADTAVHLRACGYRVDRVQCQYAAESALVVASQLIREAQKQQKEALAPPAEELLTQQEQSDDPNNTDDPCSLQDPCDLDDPNELDEEDEGNFQEDFNLELSPDIFIRKTIQIGPATVDIEIHDENTKLPMYWLIHTPVQGLDDYGEEAIERLDQLFETQTSTSGQCAKLAFKIAKPLNIPQPFYYLYRRTSSRRKTPGGTWRMARKRSKTSLKRNEQNMLIHQSMASFASQWQEELKKDEKIESLMDPLPQNPGCLADYLGCWGHSRININTAAPEVLEAAFQPLGISSETAQAIVDCRDEKPFRYVGDLNRVSGIDRNVLYAVRHLSTTSSDTFYVRVRARLGRATYSLLGGIYKTNKGELINHAVFPGD